MHNIISTFRLTVVWTLNSEKTNTRVKTDSIYQSPKKYLNGRSARVPKGLPHTNHVHAVGLWKSLSGNAMITDQTTASRGRDTEHDSKSTINVKQLVPITQQDECQN